jgi:hypothetical protein
LVDLNQYFENFECFLAWPKTLKDYHPWFGNFEVDSFIGSGAFGKVYRVRDIKSREDFAMKVVEKK